MLRAWDANLFGNIDRSIKASNKRLNWLYKQHQSVEVIEEINNLEISLDNLMKKQAILWFRCSRALWLKDGDQNTNFFRKKASNRRKRNFIWRLKDKDGVWKEEEEDVGRVLREYFIDLFSTEGLVAHTRSLSLSSLGCLMS